MIVNHQFSSNRRLPSRLFSSTRRLFGSPSPSPSSSFNPSPSLPRTSTALPNAPSPPTQQRRLAEFATVLGDYKLAVTVWESLRKDSKGGSVGILVSSSVCMSLTALRQDILPLVVSGSPALSLHAQNALSSILSSNEVLPQAQFRALLYAVRWEAGIPPQQLLNSDVEGERWLIWAAGNVGCMCFVLSVFLKSWFIVRGSTGRHFNRSWSSPDIQKTLETSCWLLVRSCCNSVGEMWNRRSYLSFFSVHI